MLEGILAYIGIGANLHDPLRQCRKAIEELSCVAGIGLARISSFYKTQPVFTDCINSDHQPELENQRWFINAAVEIRTTLLPRKLLSALQDIEMKMGRIRSYPGAPRIIDLDLLLYGQEIIEEKGLIVPHPAMHKRLFVLEPLCEIASFAIHPGFGVSLRGLKDRLEDNNIVEFYEKS